jgi:hypothetical protein
LAKPWNKDCNHPLKQEFFRPRSDTLETLASRNPYATVGEWYQFRQDQLRTWYWNVCVPEIDSRREWFRQQRAT